MKKHRVKGKISLSINLGARPEPHLMYVAEGGLPFISVRARRQTPMRVHLQGCHIIMHSIIGVPISSAASGDLGHVQNRVTRKQDMFPDMVFDSSIRSRRSLTAYVPLPQWLSCTHPLRSFYGKRGSGGISSFWQSHGQPQPRPYGDNGSPALLYCPSSVCPHWHPDRGPGQHRRPGYDMSETVRYLQLQPQWSWQLSPQCQAHS